MNAEFEPEEIYYAFRGDIVEAVVKSKNKKNSITVARFMAIGELIWTQANELEDDGYWTNVG